MENDRAPSDKVRAIQQTLLQMDKQFGKGAVLQLGSRNAQAVTVISTGSISVDAALGVADFRAAASSRFSGRRLPARPRSRCR